MSELRIISDFDIPNKIYRPYNININIVDVSGLLVQ